MIVCVTIGRACILISHAAHVSKAVAACVAQVMVLYVIVAHVNAHAT